MPIPQYESVRSFLDMSPPEISPDEKLRRLLEEQQKEKAKEEPPVKEKNNVIQLRQEPQVRLEAYNDIDHLDSRLFFHIWSEERAMAVTTHDITFNDTEDYMVMILRFPFASRGEYFPTPTSFIEAGLNDLEYIEDYTRLVDLDLQ